MASIEFTRVSKSFGNRGGSIPAITELSLKVAEGELLAIVGPSGCGKTTTLRLAAGLETPTAGTISIGGRDVSQVSPRDRDVAMVFQNYALYPHMRVAENLGFGLKMRGVRRQERSQRVGEVANLLGITHLLNRKPASLSGGEQQRVAIGRAIARRPAVFLFDEPLANLDAALRRQTRSELKRLQRHVGVGTIYVTHDQEEAMALGDRVAVLNEGRLQQCAEPIELYDRPISRFVAGFIGSPGMNFMTAEIEQWNGDLAARTPWGCLPLGRKSLKSDRPEVILGIRPQHITLVPESGTPRSSSETMSEGGEPSITGVWSGLIVDQIEHLGEFQDIHVRDEKGCSLIARRSRDAGIGIDERVSVRIDPKTVHLFSPVDGRRLD